jgi:hypothetical protein
MRILKPKFDKKFDDEFDPVCEVTEGCDQPAAWMAWSVHGKDGTPDHEKEIYAYCCDPCRGYAIEKWKTLLGKVCVCGYTVTGILDNHLRFIRL